MAGDAASLQKRTAPVVVSPLSQVPRARPRANAITLKTYLSDPALGQQHNKQHKNIFISHP